MSNQLIVSLAILKVNWDRFGRDYIENFVPLVAEVLRSSAEDVVSLPELQRQVRDTFGLDLPLNPLRQVLQRCVKHGYLQKLSGVFYRERGALETLNFSSVRQQVLALHDRVISRLQEFARTDRAVEWSEAEAEAAMQAFLSSHSLKFMFAQAEASPIELKGLPRDSGFIVGSLLSRAREQEPQLFRDFAVLAKGHLLANSIYLPDPGKVAKRFQNTRVFLDTTVLIYAAGFAGPERQAPSEELLRLLREHGAELRCFSFTLDEVQGVLDACASRLQKGQLRDAYGPTIEWFIESGRTASDIELMIARLPQKLEALGIAKEDKPARQKEFQVDEKGFEESLDQAIHYRSSKARIHDVDCIAAIAQIRRGRAAFEIECCSAIFVTQNHELARIAREHFQADAPEGAVALCISDYSLGNLLWLKNPTKAPDLPERLIIADAYAALQPSDALWKAYLAEIARLEAQGKISGDEYFALRHTFTAKRTLMELTAGDPAAFSEGTVAEVLKVATEALRSDLHEELEQERRRRASAEGAASQLEITEARRQERIEERAGNWARRISLIICAIVFMVVLSGSVFAFPWSLPSFSAAWYKYFTAFALIAFFVYSVISMLWGTSIATLAKRIEVSLTKRIRNWLARIAEVG